MKRTNLISSADIADDLGLARDYVTSKLTKRPDFPKPALRLSQKTVRWLRDDYEAWKTAHALAAKRRRGAG
jgi:predicted DNA-binding transcriptional regulator AlpA